MEIFWEAPPHFVGVSHFVYKGLPHLFWRGLEELLRRYVADEPSVAHKFVNQLPGFPTGIAEIETDIVIVGDARVDQCGQSFVVAAPIQTVDDGVGVGDELAQGVDEEKLVFGHGTAEIDRPVEVGENIHDVAHLHVEPLVDDDAEAAFHHLVVDEQDDRPPEMEVVHQRL